VFGHGQSFSILYDIFALRTATFGLWACIEAEASRGRRPGREQLSDRWFIFFLLWLRLVFHIRLIGGTPFLGGGGTPFLGGGGTPFLGGGGTPFLGGGGTPFLGGGSASGKQVQNEDACDRD
jgi:hypothetical protein